MNMEIGSYPTQSQEEQFETLIESIRKDLDNAFESKRLNANRPEKVRWSILDNGKEQNINY